VSRCIIDMTDRSDNIRQVLDRLYERDERERIEGLPHELRMLALHRDSGRFLHLICRASGARNILEIGTSQGVSTIWLAWAVSEINGKVTTVELDPDRAAQAGQNFRQAGLDRWIIVTVGDARQVVKTLKDPIDLVFLDSVKADCPFFLETLFPLLPVGGVVVADNAISHADELQDYFAALKKLHFVTMTVPIGAGVEFSIKSGE